MAYFKDGVAGGVIPIDFETSLTEAGGYRGVMGHEAAGTVEALGSGVAESTGLAVGDRVALEAGVPCGGCEQCARGSYNLCRHVRFLGSYVNKCPGALATAINHPAAWVHKLPPSVSMEEGALLEPLNVALHAVRRGNVGVGDAVVLTGAGPVGLLTALAARAAGAAPIVLADVVPSKLELARRIGAADATVVVPVGDAAAESEPLEQLIKRQLLALLSDAPARGGGGAAGGAAGASAQLPQFDVAIECSGSPAALAACTRATRPGGCLVVVANQKGPETTVPLQELTRREIDLRGIFRYRGLYPTAIRLVAGGRIDLKPLVTHRFPLDRVQEAFEALSGGEAVKVVVGIDSTAK